MAYRAENIIQGAADLYMAEAGVAIPTLTPNVAAKGAFEAAAPAWNSIGYTSDGVEVEFAPEFVDVEVDQLLDAAVIFKTKQSVTVKTTMSEATLANMLFVWGLNPDALRDSTSDELDAAGGRGEAAAGTSREGVALAAGESELSIDGGSLNSFPGEKQLAFIGSAPRAEKTNKVDKERLYVLRRILQTESSSHGLKRSEATTLPVSFRCLPAAEHTGAGYGFIRDRKITA